MTAELQVAESTAGQELPRLDRTLFNHPKPPVRIVHLGLGAFHRSHQVWYTQQASDAGEWGIASFTGRRPDAALALKAQDGLFTLIQRAATADTFEVIGSIVEAVDGSNIDRLDALLTAPSTAVVTLTVTEKMYSVDRPDAPLARLVGGLAARQKAGAGPLAIVSCDNLAHNGAVTRNAVSAIARKLDTGVAEWIDAHVSFVSTSVDRITPKTTADDVLLVKTQCAYRDVAPVVAEPFTSWILAGHFPAGRPAWEDAGALFVHNIEPFENRKLWLLNGAHSLLAYSGQLRGQATVAEAQADPVCWSAVEAFWDEASLHLTLPELDIPAYRAALAERFQNSRIAHQLNQIAHDGSTKLRMRAVPVLLAEKAAGRSGTGAAQIIAAWIDYLVGGARITDPREDDIRDALGLKGRTRTAALLGVLDHQLATEPTIVDLVENLLGTFTSH